MNRRIQPALPASIVLTTRWTALAFMFDLSKQSNEDSEETRTVSTRLFLNVAVSREAKEPGAGVLLAISQEFGKSLDWMLTGKAQVDQKKRGD